MRVLAFPARRNSGQNPFNRLLADAVSAQGCDVIELDRRNALIGRWDVFHIHWPEREARGAWYRAWPRSLALVFRLAVQRLKGARIVWTVHNVKGHDQNNAFLERALMWFVSHIIHGAIFLSESSREPACQRLPVLHTKPYAIIPHGPYGNVSAVVPVEARRRFRLPPAARIIGFLGDIRRYKGLDLLLDALAETPAASLTLFIAGHFHGDPGYATAVRRRIAGLISDGHSIVFREERLDDGLFAEAIRACDVVALPYRESWNSGLALLVLENHRRILTADAAIFRELQRELGEGWVSIAENGFTAACLSGAVQSEPSPASRIDAFCAARSWQRVGDETVAFYRRLDGTRQMTPEEPR
jgi:glycosyltransferase involved in cell wall biosynthesis